MKKRITMLLAALLVLTCCALAEDHETAVPAVGIAVTAPWMDGAVTPLLEEAEPGAAVLMNYYRGTPVEVVDVSGDYVRVKVGVEAAYLEGYMPVRDLRYGAKAMREVMRWISDFSSLKEQSALALPRKDAAFVDSIDDGETMFVMGTNDEGWVHLCWPLGGLGSDCGFLRMDVSELNDPRALFAWSVEPLEGELTSEEAKERAMEITLEYAAALGVPEDFTTREGLEALTYDIRLQYSEGGEAVYQIYIDKPNSDRGDISVMLTPQGDLISIEPANG